MLFKFLIFNNFLFFLNLFKNAKIRKKLKGLKD